MLLARLKFSLILCFLWESQVLAQALREGSSVGVKPPIEDLIEREAIEKELLEREAKNGDALRLEAASVPGAEVTIAPARTLEIIHANGYRGTDGETGRVFDQASFAYSKQAPTLIDTRALRWNLGFSSDYSGTVGSEIREVRQWGAHRPSLGLSWNGRGYKGDGATLDEIFQGASRLGRDFSTFDAPVSSRSDGAVRLADQIRVGTQSTLTIGGEFRQDHYSIEDLIDEGTVYESGSIDWKLGLGREANLTTTLKRSLVRYEARQSDTVQSQDLNELESQYIDSVSSHYQAGLGFRSLDGKRNGPVLSLIRKPDARAQGILKVSYLSGEGSQQLLGSLESSYRWTRKLRMTLNLAQDIDLLASFNNVTGTNRNTASQQTLTRSYAMLWQYEERASILSWSVNANRQDYVQSQLAQDETKLDWTYRFTVSDSLAFTSALRHVTEEGNILRPIDRRGALVGSDWKHYWSEASRQIGPRIFSQLGVAYERLWEGEAERERKTLSLALGQEWL